MSRITMNEDEFRNGGYGQVVYTDEDSGFAPETVGLDAGPAWTTRSGTNGTGAPLNSADLSSAADLTAAPTDAAKKLVLTDLVVSADADLRLDVLEETSGDVRLRLYVSARSPVQFTPRSELKHKTANKKFRLQASGAGNVSALAFYKEVD